MRIGQTTVHRSIFWLIVILLLIGVFRWGVATRSDAQTYIEGWDGLSNFREISLEEILKAEKTKIVLYYLDITSSKAIRFNLSDGAFTSVEADGRQKFICLIRDSKDAILVSVCSSTTGKLYVGQAFILPRSLKQWC
jgi:hypothetical protein